MLGSLICGAKPRIAPSRIELLSGSIGMDVKGILPLTRVSPLTNSQDIHSQRRAGSFKGTLHFANKNINDIVDNFVVKWKG